MVYLTSGFFFLSSCSSVCFKHTCCFERCVCISLEFFPLFSDDVVISLGLCLCCIVKSVQEENHREKEKKNKIVQEYGKL